ncbi:MAG: YkgJ family cysteine cluster protein [Proteobacteria bacterium]|nr:YkgJ family cysteine cluster protein [Pseudomonadota bacterium]MBU1639488.1 YkgJ family cysteine cluster protein [Pseudomonadota bacterium]
MAAPQLPENITEIKDQEVFHFNCHPGVQCFTDCCRQLELALTPYDVIRLRRQLGLGSKEFLDNYALIEWQEGDIFPSVYLGMIDDGHGSCPFVSDKGCSVYEGRPGACRTYPLGRAAFRQPDGDLGSFHVVLKEAHCHGFAETTEQTIASWTEGQGLPSYNELNDAMIAILHNPEIAKGFMPNLKQRNLFINTLYDIDAFRATGKVDHCHHLDDEHLLQAALNWLSIQYFGFFKF